MGRRKKAHQQGERENDNDYIAAAEVARAHNVSIHTIRRRILEGDIFKGAKKEEAPGVSGSEIWVIPRAEVEAVSLREISPRLYQRRNANKLTQYGRHGAVPTSSLGSLKTE